MTYLRFKTEVYNKDELLSLMRIMIEKFGLNAEIQGSNVILKGYKMANIHDGEVEFTFDGYEITVRKSSESFVIKNGDDKYGFDVLEGDRLSEYNLEGNNVVMWVKDM